MKIKRILAAAAAAAVAVSAMALSAFAAQDTSGLADGTAYLNLNKADWSDYGAEWTNAEITGDGTYTVSVKMAEPTDLGQFNALEIKNGETKFGTTYVVTIDSVKINGVEAKSAESFTCSADGAGVHTRINIYNEWNSPDDSAVNKDAGTPDQRAADGDVMSKSAKVVAGMDNMAGTETMEVTFTVSGIDGGDAFAEEASEEDASAEEASAEEASAEDSSAEDTPEADSAPTASAGTGNVPAAAMISVMAAAGAAAAASKKRKQGV